MGTRCNDYGGGMGQPDDHILVEGHAPTPFTAVEIRSGSPQGHRTTISVQAAGTEDVMRIVEFVSVDESGAGMTFSMTTPDGLELQSGSTDVRWTDLQAHASYPVDSVDIDDDVIDHPLGRMVCMRYTALEDDGTTIHWFAVDHPGMPILSKVFKDDELVSTVTVVAIEDP